MMAPVLDRTARYFAVGRDIDQLLAQWVTTIMIMVHWGLGLAVVIGGRERFSLPTYQPLIDFTGGHVWLWGVAIILSAACMAAPFKWIAALGTWIGMAWMIIWSALFFVSTAMAETSAATPGVAYAGFAMINTALLAVKVFEKPLPARKA